MNTTNCSQAKAELIPGMDMLIAHMKKQSLEIAELKEENKDLKDAILTCKCSISIRDTEIDEHKEENKKLKKEVSDSRGMFNFVVQQEEEKAKKIQELQEQIEKFMEESEEEEEEALEYITFEFVRYPKDNEGNVYSANQAPVSVSAAGPIIGKYDDLIDKIIWNSKAAKNAHKRMSDDLGAAIHRVNAVMSDALARDDS